VKSLSTHEAAALRYPCGEAPPEGQAREVAPGVLWLRIPLPTSLVHVNAWAVRDGDGWAVFDTGMHTEAAVAIWEALLSPSGPLGGAPVTRVICTHLHADHVGMAGWLTRRFGCGLWMTRTEFLQCRLLAAQAARPIPEDELAFYRRAGWDEEAVRHYRPLGRNMAGLPESYRRVQDGEAVRIGEDVWRVVVGSGHSPEHACFHCAGLGLLISGDQVLPLVSSNVSVGPAEPEADPLCDWLASIEKIRREVPDDVLVLPAHDDPFRGLHARLDRLAQKRGQALDRMRACLASSPRRVVDTFGALFGRDAFADAFVRTLATGEAVACVNHLMARGEARMHEDAQGIAWYEATA
jgi:glyoxylase-like metal-dependent hydrolase (beta-lactamase superfamily II)